MITYIAFGLKFIFESTLSKPLHIQANYYKLSLRLHLSIFEKPGPYHLNIPPPPVLFG